MLDDSLRDALDMSEMTRSMVDQLILSREGHATFSDYSSDFTSSSSSSPSSMGSKSPFDDSGDSESEARQVSRGSRVAACTTSVNCRLPAKMFPRIRCERRRVMGDQRGFGVHCKNDFVVVSGVEVAPGESAARAKP